MNDYYVYAYLREDGTPYYIGKGKGKRAYSKYSRCVKTPPEDRIVLISTGLCEQEAFSLEIKHIAIHGRINNNTGILRNRTDGGEGPSGLIHSEEARKKMSVAKKGKPSSWKGKTASAETRAKMSAKKKGVKHDPLVVEKRRELISKAKKGVSLTEKHKQALSEAAKKRDNTGLRGVPRKKYKCCKCEREVAGANLKRHEHACRSY